MDKPTLFDVLYGPNNITDDARYLDEKLFHVTNIEWYPEEKDLLNLLADNEDFEDFCIELYYDILDGHDSDEEIYEGPHKKKPKPKSNGDLLDVIYGSPDGQETLMNYFPEEVDITVGKFFEFILEGGTDPEADEEGEWTKDEDTVIEYICQYLKAKIGVEVTSIDYELVAKPKK